MRVKKAARSMAGVLLLFLMGWLAACAPNPVTGERELMLLSEADEVQLGQQTDKEIVKTYTLYQDPDLEQYIGQLGRRLASLSHRPQLSYHFKVLDTPVVNAFAVPGGYVYLTRGILSYFNDEAELAGVMGHEIGHITARHSAHQYSQLQVTQLAFSLGMALGEGFRQFAGLAEAGVSMLFLRFSRDNERQADDLGMLYATRAGLDASRMADFFETLGRLNPTSDRSGLDSWFSTHPNPPDRIRVIKTRAPDLARAQGLTHPQINQRAYLNKIDGLKFGEDPRQGYVAQGTFYHPDLSFQFPVPEGWTLQNTPKQVKMVNAQKDALILFSLAPGGSPEETARQFASQTHARVLRAESVHVNKLAAQRLVSDVDSSNGSMRILSYFIQKDERIYMFHGLTAQARFQQHEQVFLSTMDHFQDLTDSRRLNVKPSLLRVLAARRAAPLRQALRDLGTPESGLEEAAILNGKHLDDPVQAGSLLKIVAR